MKTEHCEALTTRYFAQRMSVVVTDKLEYRSKLAAAGL